MRVVSLCPSLTEAVIALGRGDALVGRTKFCVYPEAAVAGVRRVGGTKNPRVADIVALAPDWVLMNEEENRREDEGALRAAGLRVHTSFPRAPADVPPLLDDLGAILGARAAAAPLAAAIRRDLDDVQAAVARAARPPRRFAYLVWREPYMAAGADSYVSRLLTLAGGANVFGAATDRYPTCDATSLAALDPAVVLLSSEPFPFAAKHADELAAASGLDAARLHLCDGQILTWHGPRTGLAARHAARLLA